MGKIFYLMGKSSSGKDTIYKRLMADEDLHLKNIVLYTTRPIRQGEQEGIEYHFITEEQLANLEKEGRIIELRAYDTCFGIWKYCTVDAHIDLDRENYLIIGTIESFCKTKDFYGKETVIPLMIELDDGIRLRRALDREMAQDQPKYDEMCRRYLADAADFSPEKKKEAGIEKEFLNEDLDACIAELKEFILYEMRKESDAE